MGSVAQITAPCQQPHEVYTWKSEKRYEEKGVERNNKKMNRDEKWAAVGTRFRWLKADLINEAKLCIINNAEFDGPWATRVQETYSFATGDTISNAGKIHAYF